MIKIGISSATALYLNISILLLLIWVVSEHRKSNKERERNYNTLWQCPLCFYIYIDSHSEHISRCPKCSTLHKREEKG
ncbi:MAG: hypothetical protein PHI44_05215 [Candidatus Ratteibacteria bacterium]|nr:hypothetical protein [Candidatus Ratteibacteria bacterium]